ncbi:MAG: excisionase [Faecalibacillus intestinalis]|uniref:excisionase n=1 Tax=Faecalibacillus intestinalis TaxID=1982626 RepID=UPI002E787348|nr:excisionase [Faecalibacillus intestinalis]MEE0280704.1 excisionase [Faecalibacillus intestinalis]
MNIRKDIVALDKKLCLTLEEASIYTGIGVNKLREISNNDNCNFVLWIGNKRLLKRELLEKYIAKSYSL